MPRCRVTFRDETGEHVVTVPEANSLLEAALLGMIALKTDPLLLEATVAAVDVQVIPPDPPEPARHRVMLGRIDAYLRRDSGVRNSAEILRHARIKELRAKLG